VISFKKYLARSTRRNIIRINNFLLKARNARQKVVWIVGDGRSGTTWLAELINHNNDFRFMFEPFHPSYVGLMEGMELFKYLSPNEEDKGFRSITSMVFSGELLNDRVDMFSKSLKYEQLLVKDIFANLFLSWVGVNYPEIKKLLLLRHPCAVALSKSRNDKMLWLDEPRQLFEQPSLYEKYLSPYVYLLEEMGTEFDNYLLVWAIIHYVSLIEFDEKTTQLVFYENLCMDTNETVKEIFSFLNMPDAGDERVKQLSAKGSKMAKTSVIDKESAVGGWQEVLTKEEKQKADLILGAFGLNKIYSSHSYVPDISAAMSFLKEHKANL